MQSTDFKSIETIAYVNTVRIRPSRQGNIMGGSNPPWAGWSPVYYVTDNVFK